MIEQFYAPQSIIAALLKLFVLLSAGYLLAFGKLIKKEDITALNTVLLWVSLPALCISKITASFDPAGFALWWTLPLYACGMIGLSLLVARLGARFSHIAPLHYREYISAAGFHNSGYLPMSLIAFTCTGAIGDTLLVYTFLFIIGFNLMIWAIAPALLAGDDLLKSWRWKNLINPPLAATVFSLFSVFLLGRNWIPPLVFDPITLLGTMTFPLAMITLGASLAAYRGYRPDNWRSVASCVAVKLLLIPVIIFSLLSLMPLSLPFRFFLFLQSLMPSAVTLVIIGGAKNADNKFLSGALFYSHLAALITIPLGLWFFKHLTP